MTDKDLEFYERFQGCEKDIATEDESWVIIVWNL